MSENKKRTYQEAMEKSDDEEDNELLERMVKIKIIDEKQIEKKVKELQNVVDLQNSEMKKLKKSKKNILKKYSELEIKLELIEEKLNNVITHGLDMEKSLDDIHEIFNKNGSNFDEKIDEAINYIN